MSERILPRRGARIMPRPAEIARYLREGAALGDLAEEYDVDKDILVGRLNYSGYMSTGERLYHEDDRHQPLDPTAYTHMWPVVSAAATTTASPSTASYTTRHARNGSSGSTGPHNPRPGRGGSTNDRVA